MKTGYNCMSDYVVCRADADTIHVAVYNAAGKLLNTQQVPIPAKWSTRWPTQPVLRQWIHKNAKIGHRRIVAVS